METFRDWKCPLCGFIVKAHGVSGMQSVAQLRHYHEKRIRDHEGSHQLSQSEYPSSHVPE